MIRGIILYYLNIKPTHGYEIQQFISLSGMDQWTRIQSGSIYYALTKLEKEHNIAVQREERTGSRVRKIYEITQKGRETLITEMKEELEAPLFQVGCAKFVTAPILATLPREDIEKILDKHIGELHKTEEYWKFWEEKKTGKDKYELTKISFRMTIESIRQQIAWHEELKKHLSYYMEEAKAMSSMIAGFDFEKNKSKTAQDKTDAQIQMLGSLKAAIEDNPQGALENIDAMLEQMKKQ